MEQFVELILSNNLYLMIVALFIIAIVFSILKKVLKLLLYTVVALAAFLGYVYYTDSSLSDVIEPATQAVEKAEKSMDENKEFQEAKKKVEKELKK